MGRGHHYGPMPWDAAGPRDDWKPVYYHRADKNGIGFDRSSTGSNAVAQYAPPVAAQFEDLRQIPDAYLLWFHHLPWDYRMRSGRTLWEELVAHYTQGIDDVRQMRATWAKLAGRIDAQRYAQAASFLAIQQDEAQWWRDATSPTGRASTVCHCRRAKCRQRTPSPTTRCLSFPTAPGH